MISLNTNMEKIIEPKPINLTKSAIKHLAEQVKKNDATGVKLSLKKTGCSGYEYDWKIINEFPQQDDRLIKIEYENFILAFDSIYENKFLGSFIDLKNKGIGGTHLEVKSPLEEHACGCGKSISFKEE